MNTRSYQQLCGLAYALDRVGERWTILIIRELIAGPRRFKDLLRGLPDISTNLLVERLKTLEQFGLIRRTTLPPPASMKVYELTRMGRALEPTLLELGRWGKQFLPASPTNDVILPLSSYAYPQTLVVDHHDVGSYHSGIPATIENCSTTIQATRPRN
ncbi:MAG: helix-turn-helix transcriptional regulator [Herpetosiphon sp.]|nr:helix-turn-helix transcriptional regulator [Herpetosiphon sp.]